MNCQDVQRLLAAIVDDELETSEILAAQEHLETCTDCRLEVTIQRNFRSLLASPAARDEPPRNLGLRIQQSLAREARQAGRAATVRRFAAWFNMRPALALAASLLLAILGVGSFLISARAPDRGVTPQQFMAEAVSDHIRDNLLQTSLGLASPDHAAVRRWLEAQLGAAGAVPALTSTGVKLEGSRVCYLFDRRSAHLTYTRNGSRISFFVATDKDVQLPRERVQEFRGVRLHSGSLKGYNAVCWLKDGMAYALVANSSEVTQEDLLHLAQKALDATSSI